jgi:hypothetical protein
VPGLHFALVQSGGDDAVLLDWRRVHNLIIPTSPLTTDEVGERARRNHLEVAYLDEAAVGCSTVRPPGGDPAAGTFQAQAHGHAVGVPVRMTCYTADYQGTLTASSEIDELAWLTYADRDRVSPVDQLIFDHLHGNGQLR